jgi:AraC-like DNA-binding protein
MAEQVRVAALTGYFPTMGELGIDPAPLLREVGISRALLSDPEQVISARPAIRLLERSAAVTGCQTLGLRMAESRGLANLGATSLLIAHQPNLREALKSLTQYRNRINSILMLQIDEIDAGILIREEFSLREPEPARQASELALGVLMKLCTSVLGTDWAPDMVCFAHEAPPAAELHLYRRMFRCRPEFNSEFNGLVLDPGDLERPNSRADRDLAQHARSLIERVMSPEQRSTADEVEQAIVLLLPTGRANVQNCAESLGVTVRTMQRMLDEEGTSFSALLNKVRSQLSVRLLGNRRMRITDVADMLGYGSIGAFSRWHVQNFGLPPRERRKADASLKATRDE